MAKTKLMVLDVDGTLTDESGMVSPENAAAVKAALAAGVRVALATGRPMQGVELLAGELGLNGPFILTNGSLVLSGKEIWLEEYLSPTDLHLIFRHAAAVGRMALFAFQPELIHYWMPSDVDSGWVLDTVDIFRLSKRTEVPNPMSLPLNRINKVMLVGDRDAVSKVLDTWPNELKHISWGRSYPYVGEINSPGANKGRALSVVCEHLGIAPDEVLAIGDGETDVPMLRVAGKAVFISRGLQIPDLPSHAMVISEDCDRGVALAAARYIFD